MQVVKWFTCQSSHSQKHRLATQWILMMRIKTYLIIAMMILDVSAKLVPDAYERVLSHELVAPDQLKHTSNGYVHTAMIITNVEAKPQDLLPGAKSRKSKLFSFLSDLLESILMFSTGTPLHLVILTDLQSLEQINRVRIKQLVSDKVMLR